MIETDNDIWGDDLLDRREFADFLTKALVARTELISAREGQRGWTVALDAAWGAGKSFFVKRWTDDLRRQGYPVVLFDAWENDIGEEASVALMAEINEEMKQWIGKLSKTENIENKARELVVDVGRKLRKSVMPVAKVVASGLLKKAIGVGLHEILDGSEGADADDSKERRSLTSSADDVLDKVFEVSIEEHQRRKSDIFDFKKALVDLIDLIHEQAGAKYPLFVFIDELDRCRPTYAISMLEEVKHIFGMDKVCFVVSTNMLQLRHSVCAVYGPGFDSEMYLKRFFDQSVALPVVISDSHISRLQYFFDGISSKKSFFPIPGINQHGKDDSIEAIKWVFRSFDLDIRSQMQVFQMAETAILSVGSSVVHTVFMFFLCALSQVNQLWFAGLENGASAEDVCRNVIKKNSKIQYTYTRASTIQRNEISIQDMISCYLFFAKMKYENISDFKCDYNASPHQFILRENILMEINENNDIKWNDFPSISYYTNLVRYSGYLD